MSEPKYIRCNECRAYNEPRALFCSRCGASIYGPTHGGPRHRYRRTTAAGVAMGIALLLGLAVVTFIFFTIIFRGLDGSGDADPYAGQTGTPATVGTAETPTTGGSDSSTSSTLAPIQVRPSAAVCSSALKATSTSPWR
jgi:hypothetical protein